MLQGKSDEQNYYLTGAVEAKFLVETVLSHLVADEKFIKENSTSNFYLTT